MSPLMCKSRTGDRVQYSGYLRGIFTGKGHGETSQMLEMYILQMVARVHSWVKMKGA